MNDALPARARIAVLGAGQAGLSAVHFLTRAGLTVGSDGFVVLDHNPGPGGAWQHRWPSLTLTTVNGVHDLPGMSFADAVPDLVDRAGETPAREAVPRYFAAYERAGDLQVHRPVTVRAVQDHGSGFMINTDMGDLVVDGMINATGTWEHPFRPHYPGADSFAGQQWHTVDYRRATDFAGQHVVVVGGGVSAVQLLEEISHVTSTTWVTRRPPTWTDEPFTPQRGREAVARVEERVRAGLPPDSVVSVTGLMLTPLMRAARDRGVLDRLPMFDRIVPDGVVWDAGAGGARHLKAQVILWCTGFRSALDHLAPLKLRGHGGGIVMDGRLATRVAARPRLHLLGYGPSASTIGANRGGRAAVRELLATLDVEGR
ncbi:MAG: NAD(P)/FAD-dependent oxidoreductase [Propionibacteriales bacterium]|nr:NAD(P)/FAD-dependent oxidoreductase [Propionibacteriales bacterium]